jgi:hypothetical protein
MSPKQIKFAQQFVSGFMYKTDATFNTNCLKLLLSVIVSIDNTSKTFPIAYCYITSESAVSFKWVAEQLTDLAFYGDWPKATLICSNFLKGLGAAVGAKATADLARLEAIDEVLPLDPTAILEATEVVVGEATSNTKPIKLQLCE